MRAFSTLQKAIKQPLGSFLVPKSRLATALLCTVCVEPNVRPVINSKRNISKWLAQTQNAQCVQSPQGLSPIFQIEPFDNWQWLSSSGLTRIQASHWTTQPQRGVDLPLSHFHCRSSLSSFHFLYRSPLRISAHFHFSWLHLSSRFCWIRKMPQVSKQKRLSPLSAPIWG